MTRKTRVGIYLWPSSQFDAGMERAEWAEESGFDDLWIPDGMGMQDWLTLAGAVAARTKRIRICTGVVPVYTRPAAVLATSTLAIHSLAPGRFALGLGASTEAMVTGWYGLEYRKPLTTVRETTQLLRSIFSGEKTNFSGEMIQSKGFRLAEPIPEGIPIFLGAMGPKMLEMVGEHADGVILNNFTTVDRLPWAMEHLDRGAKRAGKRVEDLEIATRVALTVTDDYEAGLKLLKREIYSYGYTVAYRNIISQVGFPEVSNEMEAGFAAGDRQRVMEAIPNELVEKIFPWGNEAACHNRVRELIKAGVDTVAIGAMSPDKEEFQRTCAAFAPDQFAV